MPLTNSQYDSIMRIYSDIRSANKAILESRRKEIDSLSPEYAKISDEIGELSVNAAMERLSDSSAKNNDYKAELSALEKKRKKLLASLGKAENYLDPIYECNICKDTGYAGSVKCNCFKKRAIELLYRDSNLKNMAGGHGFDDFNLELYSEEDFDERTGKSARELAATALSAAKDFVNDFDRKKSNLFIYGNTGLGKTFLSTCIATALINTTHSVVYVTATELFNKLNTFDEAVDSSPLIDCDLLIIDDLGTEYNSEISVSKLFYCLNERLLKDKSCVISTNLDLKAIRNHYSERIFSRIVSSYKIIKLHGQDIRTALVLS